METKNIFADRVSDLQASAIREIFKLLGQSDIISLAGGSPAPESFPHKELAEIAKELLTQKPEIALQYGVTEGYTPLREIVKGRMISVNSSKEYDDTIITSGGQQGLDLTMRVLVNDGEGIIVEQPSFIGTLNSARSYNAKLFGVPVLEDGMDLDALEELLKTENIKLIYTIATFQNPTGITMSNEKRHKLLALASKYNVFIMEDNPYGELRFKGEPTDTIKSMDTEGRVIYVGSFSKILSAGLRLGWVTAHKDIIEKIVVVKQVNDVHTPILNQMMAAEYMTRYSIDEHIAGIRKLYGRKCAKMLEAMDKYFPKYCAYTRPEGGLFLFCTMPEGTNSIELMKKATANKVAFVPGHTFMIDINKPMNTFRLNYSLVPEDKIETAIKSLAEVL